MVYIEIILSQLESNISHPLKFNLKKLNTHQLLQLNATKKTNFYHNKNLLALTYQFFIYIGLRMLYMFSFKYSLIYMHDSQIIAHERELI